MKLDAVVLAGGIGKRIAPLGIRKPKAMFKILGKHLIQHILETVRDSKMIETVTVVVGPGENQIREFLMHNPIADLELNFVVQEKPLGQANALEMAREFLRGKFLVLNANDVFDPTLLTNLAKKGLEDDLDVALVGREVEDPSKFGVMVFDKDEKIIGVVEKPEVNSAPSKIAVVGLYFFSENFWDALDNTPQGQTDDQLERAYSKLLAKGTGGYISYNGAFESYKFPWDLLKVNKSMLERIKTPQIAKTAQVSPHAIIEGNVIVDEYARIFEFAVIRGPAYIGKNSIVGNRVLVILNIEYRTFE